MLIRALIVVLAIFNAGVALWWWSRPPVSDVPVPAMHPPEGVPVLQLRGEMPVLPEARGIAQDQELAASQDAASVLAKPAQTPASEPAAQSVPDSALALVPVSPSAVATTPQLCARLGPFADRNVAEQARQRAGSMLASSTPRELEGSVRASSSYRVMLPPAASRDAAQATVKRIVAAGITDYFIIGQGELANAVALGQFRNRDGAQRRLDELQEAGFPARMLASEPAPARWWLDARLSEGVSAAQARQALGSEQVQSLDCSVLR